jgi:hypothetical protein
MTPDIIEEERERQQIVLIDTLPHGELYHQLIETWGDVPSDLFEELAKARDYCADLTPTERAQLLQRWADEAARNANVANNDRLPTNATEYFQLIVKCWKRCSGGGVS